MMLLLVFALVGAAKAKKMSVGYVVGTLTLGTLKFAAANHRTDPPHPPIKTLHV